MCRSAVLPNVLETIHQCRNKRQSDEHIIRRTLVLTMAIYFDKQLTIVSMHLLKGQWFIRIDQFRVTSCASLWGQTQAWTVVQSGMLSNAQAWLTAHQHAEWNRLAKCCLFTLTLDTHIKLGFSLRGGSLHKYTQLNCFHTKQFLICIYIIKHLKRQTNKPFFFSS